MGSRSASKTRRARPRRPSLGNSFGPSRSKLAAATSAVSPSSADVSPMGGFAAGMRLFPEIVALAFGISVLVGILAGLVPAIRSAQRSITDGLRQVG